MKAPGPKGAFYSSAHSACLHRCEKSLARRQEPTSAAKATVIFAALAARLEAAPFQIKGELGVFRSL